MDTSKRIVTIDTQLLPCTSCNKITTHIVENNHVRCADCGKTTKKPERPKFNGWPT